MSSSQAAFRVEITRPDVADVAELISRHFALMRAQSPAESCHVFSGDELTEQGVRLFVLREDGKAIAIGGLKQDVGFGEIKSMHTAAEARGKGAARILLRALIDHAQKLGMTRLNLETGSGDEHAASRGLYASEGFEECPPFGTYRHDPLSLFMTRAI